MFNSFMNQIWSIAPFSVNAVFEQIQKVNSGPVDDAARDYLPISKLGSTAVIEMKGPMIKRAGWMADWGFSGSVETGLALKAASVDEAVSNILWIVDSPGGSVDGLLELSDIVKEVAAIKPVIVQVDGMMASAALYATANATKIYAGERDLIGSIGTRIMLYDYSELFKKDGVRAIPVDTGEHKSAGAMGVPISEKQRNEFQRIVDGYFSDFLDNVESGRGIRRSVLEGMADGRIFFANEEPITNGLIDGLRTTSDTLSMLQRNHRESRVLEASARVKMLDF